MISRRPILALPTLLAAPALAQADNRPSITIAVQKISNTNTLEPLREQSNVGERVFYSSLWEGLIGRDWLGDLSARPGLATAWSRVSDSVLELKLRPGVRFHNGDEMTAEDVVFSFGRVRMFGDTLATAQGRTLAYGETIPTPRPGKELPAEVTAIARRAFPALERVEAVDSTTVRFHNATPDVTLEGRLSRYGADIVSRRGYEEANTWLDWARKPITTGPYKVVDYRADSVLTLAAHDEYWGGRPPIRQIRFVEVPEVASRINGLLSGDYTFACDIPPDQIAGVERNRAFEVQGGTILNHRLTVFDKNHATLRNPLVRRAFTHAIDRQAIVDALWAGRTVVPKGLQWPFYGDMLIEDWTVPRFDLAEARRLLREAGYRGEAIPYRLLNNYYTNQVATAQVLAEGWRQAGLNVRIEMKENWSQILEANGTRAIRDNSNTAFFNDPVGAMAAFGPSGQQWASGEWRNDEAAAALEALQSSTDLGDRRAALRRMLQIVERDDPAYTVLHGSVNLTGKRRDIGWRPGFSFAMDFTARNWGA